MKGKTKRKTMSSHKNKKKEYLLINNYKIKIREACEITYILNWYTPMDLSMGRGINTN
jgi:hypothetical protein